MSIRIIVSLVKKKIILRTRKPASYTMSLRTVTQPKYETYIKFLNIYKILKETKSATMNIFRKNSFLFKSFVKAELS